MVGAAPCGRPNAPHSAYRSGSATMDLQGTGHPHRGAPTLGDIVDWFKTMTTNDYIRGVKQQGWRPFPGKLWQRNYYEHIIRSEEDLYSIRSYVAANPMRWAMDREN